MPLLPPSSSNANRSDSVRIQTGSLVEYDQHGKPILSVVVGERRSRWLIMNSSGQELDLEGSRLYLYPEEKISAVKKADQLVELTRIDQEANRLAGEVDLLLLWETTLGEAAEFTARDLAELAFPKRVLLTHIAARRALLSDLVFFKRKKLGFEPRPAEVVEQLKAQVLAEQRKARERKDLVDALAKRIFSGAAMNLPKGVELLEEAAALGSRAPRAKEGNALVLELQQALDLKLEGRIEDKAFGLLVRAGHFTPDQNLSFIRLGRPTIFDAAATSEAEQLILSAELQNELRSRAAVEGLTVAIDSAETRDVDDALSLEENAEGFRVGVHISDVSLFIKPGSGLEREALRRATSVYCPDQQVPMLPPNLSEGALSLLQGEERAVVSFYTQLDQNCRIVSRDVKLSRLSVTMRRSYTEVDEILYGESSGSTKQEEQLLIKLWRSAQELESRRIAEGALQLPRRDLVPRLLPDGRILVEDQGEDTPARKLVAELMILANETGALFAREQNFPLIFRGQEPPDCTLESLAAELEEGPAKEFALRSVLKRSTASFEALRHAGLGVQAYAHLTSPIRRIIDLINQRQIAAYLRCGSPRYSKSELNELMLSAEPALDEAQLIQRERSRFFLLKYLIQEGYRELKATVVKVEGPKPLAEIEPLHMLTTFQPKSGNRGQLRIGAELTLKITALDPRRDHFVLTEM